jgi:type II secretory pathway pseudopilin PulG
MGFLVTAWSWLSTSKLAQYIVAGAALMIALLAALSKAKRQGKAEERAAVAGEVLESAQSSAKVADQIAQKSPDQKREELSKWVR